MNRVLIMREKDFTEVKAFYWKLIEQMQGGSYLPGWEKGVYPSDIFLRESLRNRELYMLKCDGNYAAAMVLNHETNEGYSGTAWKVDADKHQVLSYYITHKMSPRNWGSFATLRLFSA